ncbi:hyaluronidase-3 [Lampris incognitus]|uniref:hyaluronidase-3 n=1 Tax=Lampris incognitus TaxID=2546036 RepID=UPI0024B6164D|nr:hyaluronidase-3 [Lampris incognitus]
MELSHHPLPIFFTPLFLLISPPTGCLAGTSVHGDPRLEEEAPLPGLAAAGPVLQDGPFVVVWNMPTARCQKKFNVHLDLRDFHIVENQPEEFQGQKILIFYRDHLGKYPYISPSGWRVNGGVPQRSDLAAHFSLAKMQIATLLQPNFTGLAVVDWEEWRPLWDMDFGTKTVYRQLSKALVRQERPGLSERVVTSMARRQFEGGARKIMEETLQLGGRVRSGGFWGFYGLPTCFNNPHEDRHRNYTGQCCVGTREENDQLAWLWHQSTALYPSIYLPERLAGSRDAALMVRNRLLEALRVASTWHHGKTANHATPVLPYARLAFTHTLHFLSKSDLEHTLGESAALGAAGVVLWGELMFAKSKHQCILLRDYIHSVLGRYVQSLRSATRRCSLQNCYGNGRCARRQPNSGHMITSVSSMTSDLNYANIHPDPSSEHFKHFLCQCYPGWTGERCQERRNEK